MIAQTAAPADAHVIRAQALTRDCTLLDDFVVSETARAVASRPASVGRRSISSG